MLRGFLRDLVYESALDAVRVARTLVGGAFVRVGVRLMGYKADEIEVDAPIDLTEDPDEDPDLHVPVSVGRGFGTPAVVFSDRARAMRAEGAAPTPRAPEAPAEEEPRWGVAGRVAAARASGEEE